MCGIAIPEGRQVCIQCEKKVLEEKQVEEKEKKESFFKRLHKNKKMQIVFFVVSMITLLIIYFPASKWIKKNLIEEKIIKKSVEADSKILTQISDVYLENDTWNILGWILHLDSKPVDIKVVLVEVDELTNKVLQTKKITPQEIEEYEKYLELVEYNSRGFSVNIDKDDLKQNVCYEILVYLTYEEQIVRTENGIEKVTLEHKGKKVTTEKYLYNGEIYNYNPLDFRTPELKDKQMIEVIENGQLCQYDMKNGVWIYFYDNDLYWVLDTTIENNKQENLYMFFHLNTSQREKLPEHRRQYNWDNRDFIFRDKELELTENSLYRVAKIDLEMEYPITYINTGIYVNEKNLWELRFSSLCIQ